MKHDEHELWQSYREFQQELEALKRDLVRIDAIRQELDKLTSSSNEDIEF
ncbi:MAG TPA: hypothetical protein VNG51_27500 [Ktedonobacteraceae bacterium]|nr:hypothetical protein [Ktedonobacteraceae bacterium]